MAIMQDQDARFQHLERKIGMFVLVALAGIVLMIAAIGVKQELFTPKTPIHFITDSAHDIAEGTAVKLRGFNIGKVERLTLTDDARVQVTVSIRDDHMQWVRKDSKARLIKEGLIGAGVIDITPGSAPAPVLAKNELIAFSRDAGLGDVVSQLRDEIVPILQDVKRITHNFQDPGGDFRQILHRTNIILANMPETQKRLDAVLRSTADELPGHHAFEPRDPRGLEENHGLGESHLAHQPQHRAHQGADAATGLRCNAANGNGKQK